MEKGKRSTPTREKEWCLLKEREGAAVTTFSKNFPFLGGLGGGSARGRGGGVGGGLRDCRWRGGDGKEE